jgi:hypothetical protein
MVMVSWAHDLFFGAEIEQMITVRDVQALSDQLARVRARAKRATSRVDASALDSSAHHQR